MTATHHDHPVRYHSLDALRAIAMLLGILLHVEMAYMTDVWPVWPVDDAAGTRAADYIFWTVHLFRMEVFFLMAGFFACMLYDRYGVKRFALHRLKRIVLPLAFGMIIIVPLWRLVFAYGHSIRNPQDPPVSLLDAFVATYSPEQDGLHPAHLWFLQDLLVMYALAIAWLWIASKVRLIDKLNAQLTLASGWILRHRLMTIALIAAPFPLHFFQTSFVVDTRSGWLPAWNIVAYYTVFFAVGWLIFRNREHLDRLADFWILKLGLGLALVPVLLSKAGASFGDDAAAHDPLILLLASTVTALLVVGSTGMFLRVFHRQSNVMRYISDSAYWLYLAHLPVVVMVNIILLDWQAPALVKLTIALALSTALLVATYQLLVRHTWIGLLLNGRRGRPPATPAPALATGAATPG